MSIRIGLHYFRFCIINYLRLPNSFEGQNDSFVDQLKLTSQNSELENKKGEKSETLSKNVFFLARNHHFAHMVLGVLKLRQTSRKW